MIINVSHHLSTGDRFKIKRDQRDNGSEYFVIFLGGRESLVFLSRGQLMALRAAIDGAMVAFPEDAGEEAPSV